MNPAISHANSFTAKLACAWETHDSLLCVGIDPDPKRFPKQFAGRKNAILEFG